jgi:hypothetical protein
MVAPHISSMEKKTERKKKEDGKKQAWSGPVICELGSEEGKKDCCPKRQNLHKKQCNCRYLDMNGRPAVGTAGVQPGPTVPVGILPKTMLSQPQHATSHVRTIGSVPVVNAVSMKFPFQQMDNEITDNLQELAGNNTQQDVKPTKESLIRALNTKNAAASGVLCDVYKTCPLDTTLVPCGMYFQYTFESFSLFRSSQNSVLIIVFRFSFRRPHVPQPLHAPVLPHDSGHTTACQC